MEKLTDFCCFKEFRIIKSFFKHTDVRKCMCKDLNTKSVIDYTIGNKKIAT
jgi:hypothetical protein